MEVERVAFGRGLEVEEDDDISVRFSNLSLWEYVWFMWKIQKD